MQFKSDLPLPVEPVATGNLARSRGSQRHKITRPTLPEHKGPENRIKCLVKGLICREETGLEL